MEYLCLRDCFVHDVYYTAGQTYELPVGESPKNFKPKMSLEEALKPPEDVEPLPEAPKTETKPKKKRKKT